MFKILDAYVLTILIIFVFQSILRFEWSQRDSPPCGKRPPRDVSQNQLDIDPVMATVQRG